MVSERKELVAMTLLISWITPLSAMMSAVTTLAFPPRMVGVTRTSPVEPSTTIFSSSGFRVGWTELSSVRAVTASTSDPRVCFRRRLVRAVPSASRSSSAPAGRASNASLFGAKTV